MRPLNPVLLLCSSYLSFPARLDLLGRVFTPSHRRTGGKPYSFASDIWSLGITLLECALGQYPYTAYTGSNYFVLLSQIINDPPPQLPADCEFAAPLCPPTHQRPPHLSL